MAYFSVGGGRDGFTPRATNLELKTTLLRPVHLSSISGRSRSELTSSFEIKRFHTVGIAMGTKIHLAVSPPLEVIRMIPLSRARNLSSIDDGTECSHVA